MKASDFAQWAGPRAAHIMENVVTAVTTVTAGKNPRVSAVFDQNGAVTTARISAVTAVTVPEPPSNPITPAAMRAAARPADGQVDDQRSSRGDHGNPEPSPTAFDKEPAAIVEHDAATPRGWAEGFATLDPDRPPADVPLRRWQQFVDDVGRFLDSGFAKKATAFGWGPFDLFGCDRDRPFARIDQQGLCWHIGGDRLVDLSENAAIIETWTGARQTWRRTPNAVGKVLAWEL